MKQEPELKSLGLRGRAESFVHAFSGIRVLWQEWNIRIHFLATCAVIAMGIWKSCSRLEWVALIGCIMLVWVAEAMNTAIEQLCDFACSLQLNPAIKRIKDIAAGAVLLAALGSAAVALIIFII